MTRRYDLRRFRSHLTYTAVELAHACKVTITTIRRWTKEGLRPIDRTRPYLFSAPEILVFLQQRNKPRQPLTAGEIYCVACKAPRRPLMGTADLLPRSETSADLVGTCAVCNRRMYRRVRLAELTAKAGTLRVRFEDGKAPIGSSGDAARSTQLEELTS